MLSAIANAIIALKQRAVEATAKRLINRRIATFGSVTSLHIDSKERTLFAQLALKGETQPIEIKIGSYEVIQENGLEYIIFQNLHASKEWIDRKSTRLNSSHANISYAVFCLKKK